MARATVVSCSSGQNMGSQARGTCYRCWWRLRLRPYEFLALCYVLFIVRFGTLTKAHSGQPWIIGVQCQVKCLEHLQSMLIEQQERENKGGAPSGTLREMMDIPEELFKFCIHHDKCHSCLQPCWNEPFEYKRCAQLCESSKSKESCLNSCQFLSNTSRASLPLSLDMEEGTNYELPVEKNIKDNQTSESGEEKIHKDLKCLDIVEVNVTESWENMGASLGWKIKHRHNHHPVHLGQQHHHRFRHFRSPILYVVQMHQLLRMEPKMATEWTVVATTPSTSSIISNALTLGLHYQARIIAVSSYGICNISAETRPFGLPKDHPVPGPPENVHYIGHNLTEGGLLIDTILWDPPNFPIPISQYLMTYHRITGKAATDSDGPSSYNRQLPEPRVRIPGNKHLHKLKNLMPNSTYETKIQAVVQLGERQLFGQITTLQFQTLRFIVPVKTTSSNPTVRDIDEHQEASVGVISNLEAHTAFFENDKLTTTLSWNFKAKPTDEKIGRFIIRLRPQHCPDVFDHRMNNQEIQDFANADESFIQFENLRFDCMYRVAIWAESIYGNRGEETFIAFETPNCHNVTIRGKRKPDCPRFAPQNVFCEVRLLTKTVNVDCFWEYRPDDTSNLSRFLVVAKTHTASHNHGSSKNAATHLLVNKDARHTVLTDLVPDSKYHVMVRAVGMDGLGPNGHAYFFVPSLPQHQGASRRAASFHAWQRNVAITTFANGELAAITTACTLVLLAYAFL